MRHTVSANIEFDEIALPDGTWFTVDGCAQICGDVDDDGEASNIEIEAIWLYTEPYRSVGHKNLRRKIEIDDRHPLWKAIAVNLLTAYAGSVSDAMFNEADEAGLVRRYIGGEAA